MLPVSYTLDSYSISATVEIEKVIGLGHIQDRYQNCIWHQEEFYP